MSKVCKDFAVPPIVIYKYITQNLFNLNKATAVSKYKNFLQAVENK